MTDAPLSHQLENEKLIVDAYINLYEFVMNVDGEKAYLRLKENNSVDWQGKRWQGIPLSFEGASVSKSDAPRRPKFVCANPNGVFSPYVLDGYLVGATLYKYRVLYDDLVENKNIYQVQKWKVWQPTTFTNSHVELELRTPMDGFNVKIPRRTYTAPDFPILNIK